MEQRRFMWVPGAEAMPSDVPVLTLSHASEAQCLHFVVRVNGSEGHVRSCSSSSAFILLHPAFSVSISFRPTEFRPRVQTEFRHHDVA